MAPSANNGATGVVVTIIIMNASYPIGTKRVSVVTFAGPCRQRRGTLRTVACAIVSNNWRAEMNNVTVKTWPLVAALILTFIAGSLIGAGALLLTIGSRCQ